MSGGISVSYCIKQDDKEERFFKTFDATEEEESRMGLPMDVTPQKPNPGEFAYSGVHDQGELPALNEHGSLSKLLTCVTKAKKFNDDLLTEIITRTKNGQDKPTKRPKI